MNNQNLDKTISNSDIKLQKVESRINTDINKKRNQKTFQMIQKN